MGRNGLAHYARKGEPPHCHHDEAPECQRGQTAIGECAKCHATASSFRPISDFEYICFCCGAVQYLKTDRRKLIWR